MRDVLFTIVMPLYNKEQQVGKAIESVLAQHIEDWQLIIIDDGSTDRSLEAAAAFRDHRIKLVSQPNQGVAAARNHGIRLAKAKTITFLDADDIWADSFLQVIRELQLQFADCDVYATSYVRCSPDGVVTYPLISGNGSGASSVVLDNYFEIAAQSDPPFNTSSIAVNQRAIMSVGGFPVGVAAGEDILTWAKLAVRFKIAYSTVPCVTFMLSGVAERPVRTPSNIDPVGDGLCALFKEVDTRDRRHLAHYVAYWHKIRASTYLQRGDRRNAWRHIRRGIRHAQGSWKLYVYAAITFLPRQAAISVFRALLRLADRRRARAASPP